MFIKYLFILVFSCTFLLFAQTEHSYIGVDACVMCHKSEKQGQQLSIWENSQHSKAYTTVQTEKADQVALEKGFKTKAVETPECLKCHAVGYNLDASLMGKKFKVEEGVQCETCHGPGSDYKSKKIMQDREQAIDNGMIVFDNPEELCTNCHNAESPTYVDFVFEEMWDKIKHPVPSN